MKIGQCKLCDQEAELQKSHMVCRFLVRYITGKKAGKNTIREHAPDGSIKTIPAGERWQHANNIIKYAFCKECEAKFSKLEEYVCELFYTKSSFKREKKDTYVAIVKDLPAKWGKIVDVRCVQADYKKLKLFQISLLWRWALANYPRIDLGRHFEKLKTILTKVKDIKDLTTDLPNEFEYPCTMINLLPSQVEGEIREERLFTHFKYNKIDGTRVYDFAAGGYAWMFSVSSHRSQDLNLIYQFTIKKDNLLFIPSIHESLYKEAQEKLQKEYLKLKELKFLKSQTKVCLLEA